MLPPRELTLQIAGRRLRATLVRPETPHGLLVLASAEPERAQTVEVVARRLERCGFATLTVDLLDETERVIEASDPCLRLDADRLAERAVGVIDWVAGSAGLAALPIGLFGTGTAASALLIAAARRPRAIHAIVSCDGRVDLAMTSLAHVHAPALLLVGGTDPIGLEVNRTALKQMTKGSLSIIAGASARLEGPGVVDRVARVARSWLTPFLQFPAAARAS